MSKTTIPINVRRDIWFAAHGRCEFAGCNKRLGVHEVTMEKCNISNYAHIIGDSKNGPRGNERSRELAQDPDNIILLCPECHRLIDHEGVRKYTDDMLVAMKKEHEERIDLVTGIQPQKKTIVVAYGPKIGTDTPHFHKDVLHSTVFPDWYPASLNPVEIQMKNSAMKDGESDYWRAESKQVEKLCEEKVLGPLLAHEISHISLFPIGPQPLLVKLGTILNDKYPVLVYQKHRIPDTWKWLEKETNNEIRLIKPKDKTKTPVLVIALSANAIKERVGKRLGEDTSIWLITCDTPNNDMMKTHDQLEQFNCVARMAMDAIKTEHPEADQLKIFMAAPASCAVELGRIRMPKADLPWVLYDYRNEKNEDVETITIK